MGIDPGTNFMGYAIIKVFGKNQKPELVVSGIVDMIKITDPYIKLQRIFSRTLQVIDSYQPDELAIEAQFYGKNVQSMLKLGRAQGVAIAAALQRDIPIFELHTTSEMLDETDAIAIAYCHYLQSCNPLTSAGHTCKSWNDFIKKNPDKLV